jgi:hypothetical protein
MPTNKREHLSTNDIVKWTCNMTTFQIRYTYFHLSMLQHISMPFLFVPLGHSIEKLKYQNPNSSEGFR